MLTSFKALLKRTKAIHAILALAGLCLSGAAALSASLPTFSPHHGVGVYRPFNWLRTQPADDNLFLYSWRCFFGQTDFQRLKAAGFDTVRIFIEPEVFWRLSPAGQQKARDSVGSLVHELAANQLKVIVAFGASPSSAWNAKVLTASPTSETFTRYRAAVRDFAAYLNQFDPASVAFEPFNEPPGPCHWTDRPDWPAFLELLYRDARHSAPRLSLVLTGACAAQPESFQQIPTDADYVKDPNTFFTLHYYDPYAFTLQSEYDGSKYIAGLPYPADPSRRAAAEAAMHARVSTAPDVAVADEPAAEQRMERTIDGYFRAGYDAAYVQKKFDLVDAWRQRAGIPAQRILVGEFGVVGYGPKGVAAAAHDDRVRWYGLVRRAAEQHGYPWLAWSYFGDMSIFDDTPTRWQDTPRHIDPGMIEALGLSKSANTITGTSAIGATDHSVCK